jgi:hypothetical protein
MDEILDKIKQICNFKGCAVRKWSEKDLDIAKRFEKEYPKFLEEKQFNETL